VKPTNGIKAIQESQETIQKPKGCRGRQRDTPGEIWEIYVYIKLLLQAPGQAEQLMKKEFASIGGSVSPMTLCNKACASTGAKSRDPKIGIIKVFPGRKLSEIKLKRTDTTLDLSQ
ncbi:hypothetical protein N7519_004328, partial [Penicillium mononematosum]|uniref:uncharacterized protein n=1 Tax=Penicillium mononematosum TaxID=268346 RepID=UPI002548B148